MTDKREKHLNLYRKTAVAVGILFLLGFIGIVSVVLAKPLIDDPNFPMH